MPKAGDLLRDGRYKELWEMCCGFLGLSIEGFMDIQKRLLLEQLELLNSSQLGNKIMRGAKPKTVEEFRQLVPLTDYSDYCPELLEKREDVLPVKPDSWVHTSGRSGEYACKWVPMTVAYTRELSVVCYGVGLLSGCTGWSDLSRMSTRPKIVYAVAPRPYMSGAMASMITLQTPTDYYPPLEEAEKLSFEERIQVGFKQALSHGFEYFFGLSLVLVAVGNKFAEASGKVNILRLLAQPKALLRLTRGLIRSKLAKRPMLPRDLWKIKGIMSSGLDSWVYKEKINELWGRYPLDLYASTEAGVMAVQAWDFDSMTFVPNLNFFEFIPEEEHLKWQLDHSYQMKTVLLDEVEVGKNYEIVITNFHGGAMVRYRQGDMVRITALQNEKLGIKLPQMVFERRVDGWLNFLVVGLTEKTIWQAIESTGVPYVDWTACKETGSQVLKLYIEIKEGYEADETAIAGAVYNYIMKSEGDDVEADSPLRGDLAESIDFAVEVDLLPSGTFSAYTAKKQAEGADLAHLKPPHINREEAVLTLLVTKPEKAAAGAEAEESAEETEELIA